MKVKSQHYVPRAYLKRFANRSGRIHVLNIRTLKSFEANVSKVAAEGYFYDIPKELVETSEGSYDEQGIEKFLAEIEGVAAGIFGRIDQTLKLGSTDTLRTNAIKEEDRAELAFYITLQYFRTRRMRDFLIAYEAAAMKEWVKYWRPDLPMDDYEFVLQKKYEGLHHANTLMNADLVGKVANVLLYYPWTFKINASDCPFYTSDHPVVVFDHTTRKLKMGLSGPGVEVALPLSSRLILSIKEPWLLKQATLRSAFEQCSPTEVTTYNDWQIRSAYRYLLCSSADFDPALRVYKLLKNRGNPVRIDRKSLRWRIARDFPAPPFG
ncbi:DUF4238 domain-containing protein [Sulfobacillus harzensis]|uniref:DUF4238 domain-containing protein n=1 Tax=Sulfobacillus harzensis TaxID=2729629 RepID=A0A7Y0L6A2_9FIRM|nr:DUF4238 domain-containing protein [Sulfobacillus harzensis]NMP23737.1 DUF4238 domain-containing protein [Sulfobacillus harzensis]